MPRTAGKKATKASKATTPILTALSELESKIEDAAPQLTALFAGIAEALDACKEMAGASNGTVAGDDDDDDEGEKPARGKKTPSDKAGKTAKKPDVEDDEPDFDSMDADELQEFIDEHELEVDLDDYKSVKKKRAAVAEAYAALSAGDDDEAPDFSSMDDDELEEFVDEHELDVDLDDYKGTKKKRAAVEAAYASSKSGGSDDDDDEGWD